MNTLAGRDLISIADLSKEEIELVLAKALSLKTERPSDLLKGRLLASCFFEPSTRTRLSFEAAMHRLGGSVIGFSESRGTSTTKGETLSDSMRMIENYADIVVIRHPQEGSAQLAAETIGKPVINAGDGANQHPTQALTDLYSIRECQGKIEDLHVAFVGDLKYGRTVHSLSLALALYRARLYFVSSEILELPAAITHELKKRGVKFSFHKTMEEVLPKVDILYMTRIQKERFPDAGIDFATPYLLKKKHLEKAKKNLRILHPLPRVDEIEKTIDEDPFAYYFQQAANGVPVRMALFCLLLEEK